MKKLLMLAFLIMFVSGCNKTICVCTGELNKESLQKRFCSSIKGYVSNNVDMFIAHTQLIKDVKNEKIWVYFVLSAKDVDTIHGYGYFYEETSPIQVFSKIKDIKFKMADMGSGIELNDLEDNVPLEIKHLLFKDWDSYK